MYHIQTQFSSWPEWEQTPYSSYKTFSTTKQKPQIYSLTQKIKNGDKKKYDAIFQTSYHMYLPDVGRLNLTDTARLTEAIK